MFPLLSTAKLALSDSISFYFFYTNLESHLRSENEFVALEKTSGSVLKDGVADAVNKVLDPLADFLGRFRFRYSFLKNNAESLQNICSVKRSV